MAVSISSPDRAALTALIEDTLNQLCIPPSLLGYQYLTHVIERVVVDPLRVKGLLTQVYPEVAEAYLTNAKAIERDVRTAICICWNRGGRKALDEMACRHLTERPWATEFIAIVARYIRKTYCR